jgi:ERCC4-type nuclease
MSKKTNCCLICDDRERSVTVHSVEFADINYTIKHITTGDYAVVGPDGALLAIIERKSLDDYGASIKDSRHANKEKLAAISAKTGCRIIYIIEGPLSPKMHDQFSRIPYKHIESSIHHLIIRDNICVLRTKDTLDTAQTLARFVRNCDTLISTDIIPDRAVTAAENPIVGKQPCGPTTAVMGASDTTHILEQSVSNEHQQSQTDGNEKPPASTSEGPQIGPAEAVLDLLTEKHIKSDIDIVRALWAVFRGISVTSADQYINLMSLGDLLCGRIDLQNLRLGNGKVPPKRAYESLRNINSDVETKLLAAIPGISRICASELIKKYRLSALLTFEAGAISIITVKGKTAERKLGMDKANKILKYFNFTTKRQTL